MASSADLYGAPGGLRSDESVVRLLFVEHCGEYAALVRETLETTAKGRFEIQRAARLENARYEVEEGGHDLVLVDATPGAAADLRRVRIEEASSLATRIPVILLTGEEAEAGTADESATDAVREQIARSRLPDEILRAVRRHRRLGPCGSTDPIVLRDPLRTCARLFARVRRTLAR